MNRIGVAAKGFGLLCTGSRSRLRVWTFETQRASRTSPPVSAAQDAQPFDNQAQLLGGFHYRSLRSTATMPETRSCEELVWIDCEMTGLDSDNDTILSFACYITGPNLDLVEQRGYEAVIHHNKEDLDKMDEWCQNQHGASGLTAAALASKTSAQEAAEGLLQYIQTHVKEPRKALLAGNTVHQDKAFLRRPPFTPIVEYLHHRILDVSAIKEAARRWSSERVLQNIPQKQGLHEAKADILESIAEARYYRQMIFVGKST